MYLVLKLNNMFKKIVQLFLFILLSIQTMAQQNNFDKEFKKLDAFNDKGLSKDALKLAKQIFTDANKTGNTPIQIKAATYIMLANNLVEEDNQVKNIYFIDTLIADAKAPAKNILHSMKAELLTNYKDNYFYQINNRTALQNENTKDITTWSVAKFAAEINSQYKQSLKNETLLKSEPINSYNAILEKGKNTAQLRPTIYDFLAHRAIDYFVNTSNDVASPSYKFIIDNENAFADAEIFSNFNFKTKDTASPFFNAIKIFQALLQFRLSQKNDDALIDADLKRIQFVNEHGVFSNKQKLYENALLKMEATYPNNENAAMAGYYRAQLLFEKGAEYNPLTNSIVQYEILNAAKIADAVIKKFPKSDAAASCKNLLQQITFGNARLQIEQVNSAGLPFKALVEYKNIDKLHCRIVANKTNFFKIREYENEEVKLKNLLAEKIIRAWEIKLPNQNDFQQHATEVKIDALPAGEYYLVISNDEDFGRVNNIIGYHELTVSNLAMYNSNNAEYVLVNRETGNPLVGATLQVHRMMYNNQTSKNEYTKLEALKADANGFIKYEMPHTDYATYMFEIIHNKESLYLRQHYNSYYRGNNGRNEDLTQYRMHLFTDRSIYRPGQTVFFKGILNSNQASGLKPALVAGQETIITLMDANYQIVSKQKVKTNSFGSVAGNFVLPVGKLNGNFSLVDSFTSQRVYISVEEYKRPKFFTEIKKPTGTYKVNDSIKVQGFAKAYAGYNIDNATVKYRVVRNINYPIWCGYYYRGFWPQQAAEMEIANGITNTNANGEFTVVFKAIPDETSDKKYQPTFKYTVYADVTDANGETRSGSETVAVAYQALQLNIVSAEKLTLDSFKNVLIKTTNINGLFEKAQVSVSISKLNQPNKIFRARYWQQPDVFVMQKAEHDVAFPHDVYKNETEKQTWDVVGNAVIENASTLENGNYPFKSAGLTAGWYKLTATTKDRFGEEVKDEAFVYLEDKKQAKLLEPIAFSANKPSYEPTETVSYSLETGFNEIYVTHGLSTNSNVNIIFNNITAVKPYQNSLVVKEEDRGGMYVHYAFVKHNRIYVGNQVISIPFSNKDLKIEYEVFRDKLEPGSQEKWKVKLTGNKAEKISAEALLSMYDESLDQFKPHSWSNLKNLWFGRAKYVNWSATTFTKYDWYLPNTKQQKYFELKQKSYDYLLQNGWNENQYRGQMTSKSTLIKIRGMASLETAAPAMADSNLDEVVVAGRSKLAGKATGIMIDAEKPKGDNEPTKEKPNTNGGGEVKIRKNFNETAFFFPQLQTDAEGSISFSFTMPEALTKWKFMLLGHTQDLASVYSSKSLVTQKQQMVQPNAPRFLREGDKMEFSAKVINLTQQEITGTTQLELFDAATNKPVDGFAKNVFPQQYFTAAAGQSVVVKFPIEMPINFNSALQYRIKAIAKNNAFSDGEEAALPVLTNRMLVTESMPLNIRNTASKQFTFTKLLQNNSASLSHKALTVEYTTNPVWYAIQALPYIMEYPYECAEQTFNRFYANAMASHIVNASPKIKQVFETWKNIDTAALMSNLEKNQELKAVLLEETPWVLNAKSEAEQKKNIALLFDLVKLSTQKKEALQKFIDLQVGNGGFSWFKGGRDDRYITQYVLAGIGHLKKLNVISADDDAQMASTLERAIAYTDAEIKKEYDELKKYNKKLKGNLLSYTALQYLYLRSFYTNKPIASQAKTAYNFYYGQAKKYWLQQSKYMQGMIALTAFRSNDVKVANGIIESLRQNSISNEEFGMYWKEFNTSGYYWHDNGVESHALLLEAFTEIVGNIDEINNLKTWLLKQKQTQHWKSTKATAEACYALLINPKNATENVFMIANEPSVTLQLGSTIIDSKTQKTEAGTGYFKTIIPAEKVEANMGNIKVNITNGNNQTSWGGVYWQYFEDLDKITPSETPLKLVKKLFKEVNTDKGPTLVAIDDNATLKIGDKVKVRVELRTDRNLEYVHMKDMRAACMEPINVLSQYKWQGGLGYYETTKDASTNFFFGWMPRGTYVFEYSLFVTHTGNYSNGITSVQCMYAPEFTSHSEGIRVNVE
jgi:hypothetical protein